MKIALDAMGGDDAPEVVVQGAIEACKEHPLDVILVGDGETIKHHLHGNRGLSRIEVHHCKEWVRMDESPMKAVRRKKNSSIRVAFELAREGEVDAVVSAGNSGAVLAAAILTLGRIVGVERPAFASIFPGKKGNVILIDVGANVDCRPLHLFQFGIMARAFAVSCLGMQDPGIGLLSIGEEGSKGNEQVRQAHNLYKSSDLKFVGNVEGRDIFTGEVEIIVCDGFVGNVALKLTEGMADAVTQMVEGGLNASLPGDEEASLGAELLRRLRKYWDYEEYGGAPLLGIKGVGIVCHGGSSPKAITNALLMADHYAKNNISLRLSEEMLQFKAQENIFSMK